MSLQVYESAFVTQLDCGQPVRSPELNRDRALVSSAAGGTILVNSLSQAPR